MNQEHSVGPANPGTLQGWKEIAGYLGRSVRAVQRWERELGLPVRRIKTSEGQTVYAERGEIDEWKRSRDLPKPDLEEPEESVEPDAVEPEAPVRRGRPTWLAFWGVAVVALVAGASVARVAPSLNGPLAQIQTAGTSVSAFDAQGRLVWRHEMGVQVLPALNDGEAPSGPLSMRGDTVFLALVTYSTLMTKSDRNDAVVAFDRAGNVLWQAQPDIQLTCGGESFAAPWHLSAFAMSSDGSHPRIWVAYKHHTWWPSMVFEIDDRGRMVERYLQNGWILGLAEWPGSHGRLLALNGVSNEFGKASTTIIDLTQPPGAQPHADQRFDCGGTRVGQPTSVFLWPKLDVQGPESYSMATAFQSTADGLQVLLNQGGGGAMVQLNNPDKVGDLSLADNYWVVHRLREKEGWLKHPADACPERTRAQPIERWMPTTGWTHSTIVATSRQSPSRDDP